MFRISPFHARESRRTANAKRRRLFGTVKAPDTMAFCNNRVRIESYGQSQTYLNVYLHETLYKVNQIYI